MSKVIAVTNQKGGVGKTTTALNLGVGLIRQGRRVCLVDADPQGDLTAALGWNGDDLDNSLGKLIYLVTEDFKPVVKDFILHHSEGIDLIPSNLDLSSMETRLVNAMSREKVLANLLKDVKNDYDYIIIDCMPSLGMITINALTAADAVLIPVQAQYLPAKEFLDDLTTRDQRMMFAVLTLVHTADSKKQLDNDTDEILTIVRKRLCQMAVLKYQQLDGLKTALPFGVRKIDAFRTLTTESLAVFMPFRVQEVYDSNGIYYGNNAISKNMIFVDRRRLMNGNAFILGVPGGGKSFMAKNEIVNLMLATDADIVVIDPENEYGDLVRALGGSVINISATSSNHINAMDMSSDYGETDPIIEKSQFLQSLCEQIIAGHKFQKGQQSILDRCTFNVCREYQQNGYQGTPPTLVDIRDDLLRQPEPEAHALALELELFTTGSLNTFAKQTNVDTSNRLICYDILELGEQLRAVGMLVILDSILNRITRNRQQGRYTYIFIDEVYLLFMHEYSAQFLYKLWKRVRKYGAFCTGITQNVADLLQSYTARTMLSNSEFIIMLNQAATDRIELAKLLNISNEQLSYITNVDAGHGLLKVGSSLVPFENVFPKDTQLYRLMTTKPSDIHADAGLIVPDADGHDTELNQEKQAEFYMKLKEVAQKNENFSEVVNRYLDQDQ